ncbi:hypothetical protein F4819DRAFT_505899 [Hypoxylon fuscum]|nr:hypothetical protein F4819DRAFT_505899 [Hypoxylon fuscum]
MAATNDTSFLERNRGCSEVVKHVNGIRERGFAANPYPCIGLYRFANLTLPTHPLYDTIVERLKATDTDETTYLDVGCCFGQDLRQLVHDGVPSDRLIGLDIAGVLMELGYDFFHDRETLESKFVVADVFKGPEQGSVWTQLQERGVDVMHCSAFFHLFTLEEQVAAAKHLAGLVKRGGIIVGRQIGSVKPGNVPAIKEQSFSYRHDVNTFEAMWREVGEATQTRWKVEGTMDMIGINTNSPVEDENSRRFLFTVTRIE